MKTEVIRLREDREFPNLTAIIHSPSPEMLGSAKRPAVLICPGGGYFNCSDREAEPVALRFAARGYHAFVLRYSTYTNGGAFPDLSKALEVHEDCLFPKPMEQIGGALRLIGERAEEWLVDMDRVAVCGFSAGGHNAAMYAARWQESPGNIRPAAAVLGYPLTDYLYKRDTAETNLDAMAQLFFRASDTVFLGTPEPSEEQLLAVSPARLVTDKMPPTFLWATAADELVPVQHSLLMAKALSDQKIPYELHIFEKGGHGLALADQSTAAARSQTDADAAQWAELALRWLEKRFALPLAEKTPFELEMEQGRLFGVGTEDKA